jgi:pentachlorophenol monooxygenase/3-(3-hydroxy-phenyl)propionate hydroxylase
VTWSTARTYYKAQELFSVTLADAERSEFPPFVNISQSRTEEVLAGQMADNPLAFPFNEFGLCSCGFLAHLP